MIIREVIQILNDTIYRNYSTDATDDTKTASPKAVKTYVDNAINSAILGLLGGES